MSPFVNTTIQSIHPHQNHVSHQKSLLSSFSLGLHLRIYILGFPNSQNVLNVFGCLWSCWLYPVQCSCGNVALTIMVDEKPNFISPRRFSWNSVFSSFCDCFQISDSVSDLTARPVCQIEYLVCSKVCTTSDPTQQHSASKSDPT